MARSNSPFTNKVRGEYDDRLMNAQSRSVKAKRLRQALEATGLWDPPEKVLDVGSGSGLLLAELASPAIQCTGCDLRINLFFESGLKNGEIFFVQADASQLPFKRRYFDLVFCVGAIEEVPAWRQALQAMAECVAPGGVLCVTVNNGTLLNPLYSILEKIGVRIPESWWLYAKSSLRFAHYRADEGLGVDVLKEYNYTDLTPWLARVSYPILSLIPVPILGWLLQKLAPSLGHAWRHPINKGKAF